MLKLKGITKIYDVADEKVVALDGVDIELRKSEFVSILGPSGCGKTTLLNVIGGLDAYTSGELEISGVSTSQYTDRDWDSYRNHSIGFVFQNYNLIQHLTVVENVELALTLVGEDKETRTAKALAALERVGLRHKALKKPNQLSGGQMQRVAIARAIINNPDIILADEPTGALDSETSVQIMGILKEISKTRLVVMVTHNGELAREYSTRIIRLLDGRVIGDTNPYKSEKKPVVEKLERKVTIEQKNPVLALRLEHGEMTENFAEITEREVSTAIKCCAQEICGVKFAVFTTANGKIVTPMTAQLKKMVKGGFYEKKAIFAREVVLVEKMFCLKAKTKESIKQADKYEQKPAMKFITALKLSLKNLFSKKFRTFLTALAGSIGILGIALVLGLYSGLNGFIERQEVALASYPITITRYTNNYESMVDTVVSALDGLDGKYEKDKVYVYKLVQQILANQNHVNEFDAEMVESIETIDNAYYYDIYKNFGLNFNAVKKIPSGTNIFDMFTTSSAYYMSIDTNSYWSQLPTKELVLEQYELIAGEYPKNRDELVLILDGKNQISDINLFFNGLNLSSVSLNYKEGEDVDDLTFDVDSFVGQKFRLVSNDNYYHQQNGNWVKNETTSPSGIIKRINEEISNRVGSGYRMVFWRGNNTDDESFSYTYDVGNTEELVISGVIKLKDDVSVGVLGTKAIGYTSELTERVIQWSSESNVTRQRLNAYMQANPNATDLQISSHMKTVGYSLIPDSISIYCKGYDAKSAVKAKLNEISDIRKAEGKSEIVYSDLMSVVLNIVQQFINIITCALLCLTAISLIVSALMIGITTYVSVLERTREIGVLRALGARKMDISRIFNAETLFIGLVSGALGVIITYIISWPLGAVMASLTGISGLVALPWYFALVLVAASMIITVVAGLIPATIAKKKDPVKALRAE